MTGFAYRRKHLHCDEVALEGLARHMGTPLYVYSAAVLRERYRAIRTAFTALEPLICYSLKANSNLALISVLAREGAGADIVSGGELSLAIQAGIPAEQIVFAGVGKRQDEIVSALRRGVLMFNVESTEELRILARTAQEWQITAPVAFRVNPDIDAATHHYITTGTKRTKFGLSPLDIQQLLPDLAAHTRIKLQGFHVHLGSQIQTPEPYRRALEPIGELLAQAKRQGLRPRYLDLGGGFGIPYQADEGSFDFAALAEAVEPFVRRHGLRLILEPGRSLVAPAGALVTELLYRKQQADKQFYIVDAAMNDLIRPALYQAVHRIVPLAQPDSTNELTPVDVVGPVCESSDFLGRDYPLPPLASGAYLAVMDTGAYGFAMSSGYNGRTRPAEIMVDGTRWYLVRERENGADLQRGQYVPHSRAPWRYTGLRFAKMEGAGNDFVVVDNRDGRITDPSGLSRALCAAKTGVGADGLLVLESSDTAAFLMRTFNPDGSEAEMCGNGARCAARYAHILGIIGPRATFTTPAGPVAAEVRDDGVELRMKDAGPIRRDISLSVPENHHWTGYFIDTGVPHLVIFTPVVDEVPLMSAAPLLRYHAYFQPQGTNVDFVQLDPDGVTVRTYERGVEAETWGCGTGAVAAALVTAAIKGRQSPLAVRMKGGTLEITWQSGSEGVFHQVCLRGNARMVYQGTLLEGGLHV